MKIGKVYLCNFGSFHGVHKVSMDGRGLVFVVGVNHDEPKMESNGAGKSTLFDAVDWALFGKPPKKDKADSIINEKAGKACWVIVELKRKDEPSAYVYRYRGMPEGNGVKFYVDTGKEWTNASLMDSKETDARIEDYIGMDRDIFLAAVYRQQGDSFNFADATDTERKRILSRILPELSECDQLLESAKAKAAEAKTKVDTKLSQIQSWENQLEQFKATDHGKAYEEWEKNRQEKLQHAVAWRDHAYATWQNAQEEVQNLGAWKANLAQLQPPQLQNQWEKELEHRKLGHGKLCTHRDNLVAQCSALEAQRQKFQTMGVGQCSECHQEVSGEHLQKEVARLTEEVTQLKARIQKGEELIQTAWSDVQVATQHQAQEKAANDAAWQAYANEKAAAEAEVKRLGSIDLQALATAYQQADANVNAIGKEQFAVPDVQKDIDDLTQKIAAAKLQKEQDASVMQHWAWWVEALGNKGIKSYILDARVEKMTEAANAWVQAMTGGTMWVRFETQSQTAKGQLNESFNVRIFRHNPDGTITERNYRSWSGGEKKRVALAIDQGLSELVAGRAQEPWSLYIIDESFRQHMDSGGREAVFELLQGLKRDSIFVVDHDKEMAGQFENHLEVHIKDRASFFPKEPPVPPTLGQPSDFLPHTTA